MMLRAARGQGGRQVVRRIVAGQGPVLAAAGQAAIVGTSARNASRWAQGDQEDELEKITQKALVHELSQEQVVSAGKLVPWFLRNMPQSYFKLVDEAERLKHLKALSALYGAGADLTLTLKSDEHDGTQSMTYIRPDNRVGLLLSIIRELPPAISGQLVRLSAFTSLDNMLVLNQFSFGNTLSPLLERDDPGMQGVLEYARSARSGNEDCNEDDMLEEEELIEALRHTDPKLIATCEPRRVCKHMSLYHRVQGTEGTDVDIEPLQADAKEHQKEGFHFWVTVAMDNVVPRDGLKAVATLFSRRGISIDRAHLNVLRTKTGTVTMMRTLVVLPEEPSKAWWSALTTSIKRMKWLDDNTIQLGLVLHPSLGLTRAEIITAMCGLLQGVLAKENRWSFSHTTIQQMVRHERYVKHAAAVADLFQARFDPCKPLSDADLATMQHELRASVRDNVEDAAAQHLLDKMIDTVGMTYRTNLFMPNRFSLALRLDPKLLEAPSDGNRELPYGVFFVHGRNFNAFHCRFRDIARGGMRLVTPNNVETFAAESLRHYDEVYNLAFAQQLKNKDIPEGGSKAVVVVDILGQDQNVRNATMRAAVKGFADAIVDLIVETDEAQQHVVNFWTGRKERLYLGPDEQVLPSDISWVVDNAAKRGWPAPATFMSSKADEGINHKEFGVTSEGVVVFLDEALRFSGIDPHTDQFTVKLTGGPSGDVAGNCVKILHREYPDTCRVVGMADHSGCVEDPNGLNWDELLRLVKEELPIAAFRRDKLDARGELHTVETEQGIRMRNTMHNRLVADAFIPAGGRPETISLSNWKQFLRSNGKPSSGVIVEGANLFITKEARTKLHEAGVLVVKDSSANKCGVICSSFEIIASMLLTKEEFRANKKEIVQDVLQKLKAFARMEASLLFRQFANYPGELPFFSMQISSVITALQDKLYAQIDVMSEEELAVLLPVFERHLPVKVLEIAKDRIREFVPEQYIKIAIASSLASQILYKEGPVFVDNLPPQRVGQIAFDYHHTQAHIEEVVGQLKGDAMTPEVKQEIVDLLLKGGVRTMLT